VQDEIAMTIGSWPDCPTHTVRLRPEVRGERALWLCHLGRHVVSAIGELPGPAR
jgi:hypothetical protein